MEIIYPNKKWKELPVEKIRDDIIAVAMLAVLRW
jgi:hypothetical protein